MRTLAKIALDVEAGNAAIKSGELERVLLGALDSIKPEAAYFGTEGGKRTACIVDFTPVMTLDDLKNGLEKFALASGLITAA